MQIVDRLVALRDREHGATVALIEALVECQRTRAHVDAGYRSVFRLLVERLHYSPAAASRRFAAMRCALRSPRVIDMLRDHRTSLSALAKIAPVLDEADDVESLLRAIDGKSPDEVDAIVAARRPVPKPAERVRPIAVRRAEPAREVGTLWGSSAAERNGPMEGEPTDAPCADAARSREVATTSGSAAEPSRPNTVSASDPEPRVALHLTLSATDHAAFERARARLGRSRAKPLTLEETVNALVAFHARHETKRSPKRKRGRTDEKDEKSVTRHVPRATRDAVFERDGHRCTFVAPDGTRCSATGDLQIDHVRPFALGGGHDAENLRVLCGAHNRRRAERTFGMR